jgi:transcription initiation factor TFIIIB Brf1 subunit/transcription initiation factor TFIIB
MSQDHIHKRKNHSFPRSKQESSYQPNQTKHDPYNDLFEQAMYLLNQSDDDTDSDLETIQNENNQNKSNSNENLTTREEKWKLYNDVDSKNVHDHQRCQYRKNSDKGIDKDLRKLNLPNDVIAIADQYYYEVTKGDIKRSNLRKGIMFACVFQSYKDLGKPQTPDDLQKLFKITRKNSSKGITYFHLRSEKKSGENGYITAEHFIPKIMESFSVKQEHIQAALDLYHKLKDKDPLFNSSNPQSVGSGLVYYYFKKINVDISGAMFGKAVGLSEITIIKISNKIDEILSTLENE